MFRKPNLLLLKTEMKPNKIKNLVVVRAGSKSLHKGWISSESSLRGFDLLVCCYSPEAMDENSTGVSYVFSPGNKISGYNKLIKEDYSILAGYDRVAFLDDDLKASHNTIKRCFDIGEKENLFIWQPSLDWTSYFTYAGTLQVKGISVRYVNYVEMMAPFFKLDALEKVKDLFDMGFESGIDLIWCSMVAPGRCGIIDETPVFHTRPVGGQKEQNGFIGRSYEDDIESVLNSYNYIWPSLVASGAKKINGATIGRFLTVIYTIQLFFARFKSPNHIFFRLVADHIRHMATRPFNIRFRNE